MIYSPIINAINKQLKAINGAPVLAEENTSFKPVLRTPWMRSTLLPSEPVQMSLGDERILRYNGICQVDVFFPVGSGSTSQVVDQIVAHFNSLPVRFLDEAGEKINIKLAWRGVGVNEPEWYKTPIFIRYEMFTQ